MIEKNEEWVIHKLGLLQEESAEIIHIISKIRRFGFESTNPKYDVSETSSQLLHNEIGDFLALIDLLIRENVINEDELTLQKEYKKDVLNTIYPAPAKISSTISILQDFDINSTTLSIEVADKVQDLLKTFPSIELDFSGIPNPHSKFIKNLLQRLIVSGSINSSNFKEKIKLIGKDDVISEIISSVKNLTVV